MYAGVVVVYRLETRVIELKHVFKSREIVISQLLYPLRVFHPFFSVRLLAIFSRVSDVPDDRILAVVLFSYSIIPSCCMSCHSSGTSRRVSDRFPSPHTPKPSVEQFSTPRLLQVLFFVCFSFAYPKITSSVFLTVLSIRVSPPFRP